MWKEGSGSGFLHRWGQEGRSEERCFLEAKKARKEIEEKAEKRGGGHIALICSAFLYNPV